MTSGRVHFVVGVSRCGITPLSRALNLHPHLAVFGESRFFGRYWVEPETPAGYSAAQLRRIEHVLLQFRWTATVGDEPGCLRRLTLDGLRQLLAEVFSEVEAPIRPGELFMAIAERVAEVEGKRYALEKTPHHLNWVGRIVANVPGARFVVLLADPYTFARFHSVYDTPSHPLASALMWRGYMRSYERAARRYRDRIVLVDASELGDDPTAALVRVQRFFDLELRDLAVPLAPVAAFIADADDVGAADVFWVNLLCRRLMRRHGYEPRPTPVAASVVLASLASLPRFCVEVLPRAKGPSIGSARYVLRWLRL